MSSDNDAPRSWLLHGGRIASEDSTELLGADVLVEGDRIARIGQGLQAPEGCEEVDCTNKVILPGMFDLHVHAREPGREDKETIASCTEAAINGGVTGIQLMPDTSPPIDGGGMVQAVIDVIEGCSRIEVRTAGCITRARAGRELAGIAGMKAKGVVMITDDDDPVEDPQVLRRAMEYASDFDMMLASNCQIRTLSGGGAMNEGRVSYRLGIPGIPAISEEICLARDIRLARYTGAHVHILQVSTAEGLETIRRFKSEGVRVTCGVAPHHLYFSEEDVRDYDTHYKTYPPLRTQEDNERLVQGLIDGVIDVIATDHAPHTEFEKNTDFVSAPFGITGLETALVSLHDRFVKSGAFGWDLLVKRFSAEPRRLLGLEPVAVAEGESVNLVVFDPGAETTFSKGFMRSQSSNTPFIDQTLSGQVVRVQTGRGVLLDRMAKTD